jgi:DNA-binding CsgD family transcriptional regulator
MTAAFSLVQALIDGVSVNPPWSGFLDGLRAAIRADYASIVFRPLPLGTPQTRVVHLASGNQSPPFIATFYRERLYKEDPLPYFDLSEGRIYALEELLTAGDVAHENYRRNFVEPSGMNVLRIVRVREASGVNAWMTVTRRDGTFSDSEMALFESVVPPFRSALANHVALERERTKALVMAEAIRRMNFGWITLDAKGGILDADPLAEAIMAQGDAILRSRSGALVARSQKVRRELAQAMGAVTGGSDGRPRAIVLKQDPWLDMLLVPASLADGAAGPGPAAIAYVHAEAFTSGDRCDQLCQIFGLIPCEARLALALSLGMSITEAAASLGLTVESARTYSKRIYAKTGARGQTDLVRFIHRSVATIT